MLDGTGTKLESSPHISMAIEQNDISADQRPLPMKKELPVNSSPNHEKHPQHHQQKDQQLEDKDDDASNTSIRLDKAECLCKDDKILAAASLLEGIDPKFFRPIHRYILHEASLFHRLIENSSSIIEPANNDDDDDESPENEGQWIKQGTHQRGQRNFAIYYKMDHARSQLTCRIETPIPSSLLVPLLSVLNESELYSKWIPEWKVPKLQVVKSEKLRQSGRCSQIIHVVTVVPWPLAKRELFLKAVACDDIHSKGERRSDGCSCEGFASRDVHRVKNRILIRIQSLDVRDNDYLKEEEEGLQIPPLQNGGVRMEVDGGFVIEKCPSDHPMAKVSTQSTSASDQKDLVLVTFSFTVDPKLPIIPKSFINFFLRTAMGQIWNMFLNVAEDVKVGKRVEHCKEIERKRDLYDWIEERTHVMLSEGSDGGGNGGGNVDGDDDDDFVA